jgi:hypothetical protein
MIREALSQIDRSRLSGPSVNAGKNTGLLIHHADAKNTGSQDEGFEQTKEL